MTDRHEKREIAIFKAFAKIASLQIIIASIKKNAPPEPDIQCRVKDLSYLSFELVEIIDRNYANLLKKCYKTGTKLRGYYLSLPQDIKDVFDRLYSNGMIFPIFKNSSTLRQRINLFPKYSIVS
jgi:hypothetical protein